jgi:hypothetical protein
MAFSRSIRPWLLKWQGLKLPSAETRHLLISHRAHFLFLSSQMFDHRKELLYCFVTPAAFGSSSTSERVSSGVEYYIPSPVTNWDTPDRLRRKVRICIDPVKPPRRLLTEVFNFFKEVVAPQVDFLIHICWKCQDPTNLLNLINADSFQSHDLKNISKGVIPAGRNASSVASRETGVFLCCFYILFLNPCTPVGDTGGK